MLTDISIAIIIFLKKKSQTQCANINRIKSNIKSLIDIHIKRSAVRNIRKKTNRHRDYLYAMPAYNIIQMLQDCAGIYIKINNAMDIKPLAAR